MQLDQVKHSSSSKTSLDAQEPHTNLCMNRAAHDTVYWMSLPGI